MKPTLKPIIFFGSGPVAAASLELLLNWQPISTVVTKHTPPHHKEPAPVEILAKKKRIALLYADTRQQLDNLKLPLSTYGIVIDYGVIISQAVIDHFPLGIINSHFSLLPHWRGADPITYSLLSGQSTTGVSIMLIDKGLDTGPLLTQRLVHIDDNDTNSSLTNKLIKSSDAALQASIPGYSAGLLKPTFQANVLTTYSQKLTKEAGVLSPHRTATELSREIRAFESWPKSRLFYNNNWFVIHEAHPISMQLAAGELIFKDKALLYGCKAGSLAITLLQPAGKNKMTAAAFYNGYGQKMSIKNVTA